MAKGEKKVTAKNPKSPATSRRMKPENYKSFKLSKRIKHPKGKVKGSFRIFRDSFDHLTSHWKIYGGITVIYLLLNLVLVKGLGGGIGLADVKDVLNETSGGEGSQLFTGLTLYGLLLGSASSGVSEGGNVYQTMLTLIFSVVLIWTLRQTFAGKKVRIRDGFYKGVYPLIQFILVLCVIGLQFLPLGLAGSLYMLVIQGGLAVSTTEVILWLLVCFGMSLLTLYWISSSLFALYIVTLPEVTPMPALRAAKDLVRYRRWEIMRKVLFLPVALFFVAGVIMLPIIMYATPFAESVFFSLSMLGIVVVHSYMYTLYRELL